MPTYSYACSACGHRFESVQSIHDAALTTCPVCDGNIRRVISAVGVTFKGSGFYRTDSRARATTGAGTSSAAKASTQKPSAETKSDTKPATSVAADPA